VTDGGIVTLAQRLVEVINDQWSVIRKGGLTAFYDEAGLGALAGCSLITDH
jgi:hypothetical protein